MNTAPLEDLRAGAEHSARSSGRLGSISAKDLLQTEPGAPNPVFPSLFDVGDKVQLVGASKVGKTFFALQLCLCLSSGRPFIGFEPARRFKVLLLQGEINCDHFHRRIQKIAAKLSLGASEVERLRVINLRGRSLDFDDLFQEATRHESEIILLDPFYKLFEADEMSAQATKEQLRKLDEFVERTNAALIYVHHEPKGHGGERALRDRGAGSGMLARDYDACISLLETETDELLQCEFLLRNYPPCGAFTLRFMEGVFEKSDEIAKVKTSASAKRKQTSLNVPQIVQMIQKELDERECSKSGLIHCLNDKGVSQAKARAAIDGLEQDGRVMVSNHSPRAGKSKTLRWVG